MRLQKNENEDWGSQKFLSEENGNLREQRLRTQQFRQGNLGLQQDEEARRKHRLSSQLRQSNLYNSKILGLYILKYRSQKYLFVYVLIFLLKN